MNDINHPSNIINNGWYSHAQRKAISSILSEEDIAIIEAKTDLESIPERIHPRKENMTWDAFRSQMREWKEKYPFHIVSWTRGLMMLGQMRECSWRIQPAIERKDILNRIRGQLSIPDNIQNEIFEVLSKQDDVRAVKMYRYLYREYINKGMPHWLTDEKILEKIRPWYEECDLSL